MRSALIEGGIISSMRKGLIVSVRGENKICNACRESKHISFFHKRTLPSGTLTSKSICKDCSSIRQEDRRSKYVATVEEKRTKHLYNKEYWRKNREKLLGVNRRRSWGWYREIGRFRYQKPEWRFTTYRKSAQRSGRQFSLSLPDFLRIISLPCHYCGIYDNRIGVDRVDNQRGYLLDNCVPCCKPCNLMKRSMPVDLFIKKCKEVANHNVL